MEDGFKLPDETGLKLKKIEVFEDDIAHAVFDFRVLDSHTETYETAEIVIQLRGLDVGARTIASLEGMALKRARSLTEKLTEHIAAKLG